MQALTDASPDVREQAAFGLGQLRDKRAVEPLTNALKDAERGRARAGGVRARPAPRPQRGGRPDRRAQGHRRRRARAGGVRARTAAGSGAVDGLASALHDAKPTCASRRSSRSDRSAIARAVEPLISALKDSDADVREQAAFALGQIRDRAAVEALVIALKDSVADVREQAAFALGQIRDPRAIDGLTAALKDPTPTSASRRPSRSVNSLGNRPHARVGRSRVAGRAAVAS